MTNYLTIEEEIINDINYDFFSLEDEKIIKSDEEENDYIVRDEKHLKAMQGYFKNSLFNISN